MAVRMTSLAFIECLFWLSRVASCIQVSGREVRVSEIFLELFHHHRMTTASFGLVLTAAITALIVLGARTFALKLSQIVS